MKTIIIYSTKYGCAEKAANILKAKLSGEIKLVNIMKEKVQNLDEFDNVILGGSIYIGKIQKKMTEFVAQNLPQLLNKKVGLFICAGQPEPVRTQELESSFPKELYNHASAKEVFGHEFVLEKMNFLDKLMTRMVAKTTESKFELSEEKIESFAKAMS